MFTRTKHEERNKCNSQKSMKTFYYTNCDIKSSLTNDGGCDGDVLVHILFYVAIIVKKGKLKQKNFSTRINSSFH